MANHKSAIKRNRQSEQRRAYNRIYRTRTRTFVKRARAAQEGAVEAEALQATREAIIELDKAASKGVIHKRNAARRKSRLMKQLSELQASQAK